MEIKTKLLKPYTESEKIDFIVEQNHKNGYEIKETETALEAWGYTEEEMAQQELERKAKLFLTGADVERAIYQAKGMDFDDIVAMVTQLQPEGLDIKALKIELKANNFYRGNPYVNAIGTLLGFTSEQLDKFFETNDYHELLEIPAEEQVSDTIDTPVDTTGDDIKESDGTVVNSTDTNTYSYDDI